MFNFIRKRWLIGQVHMYMYLAKRDNKMLESYTKDFQKHNAKLDKALDELTELWNEESLT